MVAILDKPTGTCVMPILKMVLFGNMNLNIAIHLTASLAAHISDTAYPHSQL